MQFYMNMLEYTPGLIWKMSEVKWVNGLIIHWPDDTIAHVLFMYRSIWYISEILAKMVSSKKQDRTCKNCKQVFSSPSAKNAHHNHVHKHLGYRCNICGVCYRYKQKASLHIKMAHLKYR